MPAWIVEKNDGGGVLFGLGKRLGDDADEVAAAPGPADGICLQTALFDEAPGHQGLAQAGVAVEQDSLRKLGAEVFVDLAVVEHVADLDQVILDGFVSEDFVKRVHHDSSRKMI